MNRKQWYVLSAFSFIMLYFSINSDLIGDNIFTLSALLFALLIPLFIILAWLEPEKKH